MPYVKYKDDSDNPQVFESNDKDGILFLQDAARLSPRGLTDAEIHNVRLQNCGFFHRFMRTKFIQCVFDNVNLSLCEFTDCEFHDCELSGISDWVTKTGIKVFKKNKTITIDYSIKNEEIQRRTGGKVYSLPNKEFVKVVCECDFCHKHYAKILRRTDARPWLKVVPNSDRRVCDECYSSYRLSEKIMGNRHYGYAGSLSFYRTPMDKINTAILGLEMEFEGDFYGWKELQDAHKGQLHYGYDSSVRGQNELSWDCGSYSWWKYLSNLKDVCEALKKNGGSAGDTAGIHVHVSRPDVNVYDVTAKLNMMCQDGVFNILMRAVSLRNDKNKFDMYADLQDECSAHHAGISFNGHGTCEFRVFNSSLDYKLILKHLLFCKTLFNAVADGVPEDKILPGLAKGIKKYITECAGIQSGKGFITEEEHEKLMKALSKEAK